MTNTEIRIEVKLLEADIERLETEQYEAETESTRLLKKACEIEGRLVLLKSKLASLSIMSAD